jgi:hypothetical protein
MSRFDRRPLTDALLALLAEGTDRPAYDHGAPPDADPPYNVVWSIEGGRYEGTWGDPVEIADVVYQIDSVGMARRSAEWLADKVGHVMLDRETGGAFSAELDVDGMAVTNRSPQGGPAGVEVDGRPPHEVFSVPERYVLVVVPA